MKIVDKIRKPILLLLIVLMQFFFLPQAVEASIVTRVNLFTADNFAVLAGTGITNTGSTTISGDVGSSPTSTQTGFGSVTFASGANHTSADPNDAATQQAKTDLVIAYTDAANRSADITYPPVQDLGGLTLGPGVYNDSSSFGITGALTLDGQNNVNSVFIFQAGSTLTAESGSSVNLINGAQACNVFWQVGSSATIKTSSSFVGNILALTSITLQTSATVNGRVLARNGAVTMDTNTISKSTCAPGTVGGSDLPAGSSTSTTGSSSISCPTLVVTQPIIIESRRTSPTSIFISWGPVQATNSFVVRYGIENGKWIYTTNVTGFSTTLNALPANQPIWVQIASRNDCYLGSFGTAKLVGGPSLPNTGLAPHENNIPWIPVGILGIAAISVFLKRKNISSSKS